MANQAKPTLQNRRPVRFWAAAISALALLGVVGGLSVAEAQSQKSRGAASKKAPSPPPAPPVMRMAPPFSAPAGMEPLSFAVQSYATFQSELGDLRGRSLRSVQELDAALDRIASHNPHHLSRGLLAYGALTGAQSEPFARTVRAMAAFYGRDAVVRGLVISDDYARSLSGANDAERLIMAALSSDGARLIRISEEYRRHAEQAQRERWGGLIAARMTQRAATLRSLSEGAPARVVAAEFVTRLAPAATAANPATDSAAFGGASFWDTWRAPPTATAAGAVQTSMAVTPPPAAMAAEGRERDFNTMLRLAALYILDATKEANVPVGEYLTREQTTDRCLEMTQVQLQQCVSAARFNYEAAFCLAEQGIQNVGECVRDGRQTQ